MTAADFGRAIAAIRARHPSFAIRYADQGPWWMRLFAWLRPDVAITLGSTVWLPSLAWLVADWDSAVEVLWHEATHVEDAARLGRLGFKLRYAGALVLIALAPLALLGLAWPWCWCFALALLAAAPWPCPWRVQLEARAYAVSLLVRQFQDRSIDRARDIFAAGIASGAYYWASWSASSAEAAIRSAEAAGGEWSEFVRASLRSSP